MEVAAYERVEDVDCVVDSKSVLIEENEKEQEREVVQRVSSVETAGTEAPIAETPAAVSFDAVSEEQNGLCKSDVMVTVNMEVPMTIEVGADTPPKKSSRRQSTRLSDPVDNEDEYVPCFPILYRIWATRNRNKTGTLREKLTQMEAGTLEDEAKKIPGRLEKFKKRIAKGQEDQDFMDQLVRFYYATDLTFARDATPGEMEFGIKRRCAWAQDPLRLMAVTVAQVAICLTVIMSKSAPVNGSTAFMAVLYFIAISTTVDMHISKELISLLKQHSQKVLKPLKKMPAVRALLRVLLILFSPILVIPFSITYLLDITVGKLKAIAFVELINVVVDFVVIFTGLSVGLRSGNPINAIQTFAAFEMLQGLDELIISNYTPDLEVMVSHESSKGKQRKMLTVRILLYISVFVLLALFTAVTVTNKCYAFCEDA